VELENFVIYQAEMKVLVIYEDKVDIGKEVSCYLVDYRNNKANSE